MEQAIMEKFIPKRSKTSENTVKNFERIWLTIAFISLILLFGIKEYRDAKKVHTKVMGDISKLKYRVAVLEGNE